MPEFDAEGYIICKRCNDMSCVSESYVRCYSCEQKYSNQQRCDHDWRHLHPGKSVCVKCQKEEVYTSVIK